MRGTSELFAPDLSPDVARRPSGGSLAAFATTQAENILHFLAQRGRGLNESVYGEAKQFAALGQPDAAA